MKNLYEQLSIIDQNVVAGMLGFKGSSMGFKHNLMLIPAIKGEWGYGDVLTAYCNYLISVSKKITAQDLCYKS